MPEPGEFRGDPEGYLAWAATQEEDPDRHFCMRHWMPCPVEGKNGLIASMLLAEEIVATIPDEVRMRGSEAMNEWLRKQDVKVCCKIGDERMADIWAQC